MITTNVKTILQQWQAQQIFFPKIKIKIILCQLFLRTVT